MATDAHEGTRVEPGLGLALLTVLIMVGTTAVLAGLIYALMLGVAATSAGRDDAPAVPPQPPVSAQPSQQQGVITGPPPVQRK